MIALTPRKQRTAKLGPGDPAESVRRARKRCLARLFARHDRGEPRGRLAADFLEDARRLLPARPGEARHLARLAQIAAQRDDALAPAERMGLLVAGECVAGDACRRLGWRWAARRSFGRAARLVAHGCGTKERAYFLATLAHLREGQARYEEALALRGRAARLYDTLGEVDLAAATLADKAALEIARAEVDGALHSLSQILLLMDEGLDGRLAAGAAIAAATLLAGSRHVETAIAGLEMVRARYPRLAGTAEMAELQLLSGRLLARTARGVLAEERLTSACGAFLRLGDGQNATVAALEMAVLYLQQEGCGVRLRAAVEATTELLLAAGLREGVREGLALFRDAVRAGRATVALAHALLRYVERSALHPEEKFIPPPARDRR